MMLPCLVHVLLSESKYDGPKQIKNVETKWVALVERCIS